MSSRDLIFWRLSTAIFWSIGVQFLFFILILFVVNFNPWHPILWIQYSVSKCLSFGTWLNICPLAAVIFAQGLVCSKDYVIVKKYHGTRFIMICNIFSLHNLIIVGLHIVIGGVITWMYLSLLGGKYSSIIECSEDKKRCLGEEYLFLLLNGFWIGVYTFMQSHFVDTNTLSFPVVQQLKFLQVKAELQLLVKQAVGNAIMPTLYFFLFYFWKRESVQNVVCGVFDCSVNKYSGITGFGLINVSLLFYSWLSSATFILTMNTLKLLFQVHLTESIVFPITTGLGNSDALALHQALAMRDLPIIQYLGFLDLKNLAEKDRSRREELFTLSQPGGHPYNWNAIITECLKLVKAFTEDLNKANIEIQPPVEAKSHSVSREYFPVSNTVTSPSVLNRSGIRNLSLRTSVTPNASVLQTPNILHVSPTNITNIQAARESLANILKLHLSQIVDMLCKKPGISFIFGEIPDAKVRYYLAQAQPIIWTVQGLAQLTAASFKEDTYGVVQKDLPEILTVLLQLKQALDKLQRIGNYKKSHRIDYFELKMKSALRSAVKHSLYCICIEFGDYVKELKLTKDVFQQLQPFLLFREG